MRSTFPITIIFLALFFLSIPAFPAHGAQTRKAFILFAIDGDTAYARGGVKIRYIGIDSPEKDEPLYAEAKQRNAALVGKKTVMIRVCEGERKDKYGRLLAWVYTPDGKLVNDIMLEEGLARTLVIPPCGLERIKEIKKAEKKAKDGRIGIWSQRAGRRR